MGLPEEPSRRSRWSLPLITFVIVVVGGPLYWFGARSFEALTTATPRCDERAYLLANDLLAAGANPYSEPGYLYTPAFVIAGTAFTDWVGTRGYLTCMRVACLLGLWVLLWVSLSLAAWPPVVQAAATAIVVTSPIVQNALGLGNVSLAIVGPLVAALLMAHRRPLVAGVLLGGLNGLKPIGLTAIAVLLVQPRTWVPQGWRRTVAASTAAVAGLLLLVGAERLGPMVQSVVRGRIEWTFNISFHRALVALGLPLPASIVFVGGTLLAIAIAIHLAEDHRRRLALATVATLVTLPVNNPHGFLLILPVGVIAIDRATARYRAAKREGRPIVVPLSTLALVFGAVTCTLTANGAVSAGDLPLRLHGAVTMIPFVAAMGLAWHVLRDPPPCDTTPAASRHATLLPQEP